MSASAASGERLRVAVATGTRAEFGLLQGVLDHLESDRGVELQLYATGTHLRPEFGDTLRDIESRFRVTAKVPAHPPLDSRAGMALALAEGVRGFVQALSDHSPQLLILLGDRTETFAAALAASYLDIPIAHIHGGDVSGNPIDDFQRDAISGLAALHFAATPQSADRLRQLGSAGVIQVVGAPGVDHLSAYPRQSRQQLAAQLGLSDRESNDRWLVVLFHPNPAHVETSGAEAISVFDGAWQIAQHKNCQIVVLGCNSDAGHRQQVDALAEFSQRPGPPRIKTFKSLPREDYLDLLSHAELLIGNSSSGVIESGSLGVAVVDIGDRQHGRQRDDNVVHARPSTHDIVAAAHRAFTDRRIREAVNSRKSIYGDGNASSRIAAEAVRFLRNRPLPQLQQEGQTA